MVLNKELDFEALLAQSVERETLNLKVVGSTPTWGASFCRQPGEWKTGKGGGNERMEMKRIQYIYPLVLLPEMVSKQSPNSRIRRALPSLLQVNSDAGL
jgi:hypothetical protein